MPTYTFCCSSCAGHWDEYLTMDNCREPLDRPSECCGAQVERIYTVPQIISDDLGFRGVFNPVDGKTYDSRAAYHRTLKENGCEVMDTAPTFKPKEYVPKGIKEDIAQAIQQHS